MSPPSPTVLMRHQVSLAATARTRSGARPHFAPAHCMTSSVVPRKRPVTQCEDGSAFWRAAGICLALAQHSPVEGGDQAGGRRWVVVRPPGAPDGPSTGLLLAR